MRTLSSHQFKTARKVLGYTKRASYNMDSTLKHAGEGPYIKGDMVHFKYDIENTQGADSPGDENTLPSFSLPVKLSICENCGGHGHHMNESMRSHAYTQEEMAEEGPEFLDEMQSGMYDVSCKACNGTGRVYSIDEARVPANKKWLVQALKNDANMLDEEMDAEDAYRRMEGGW
jgi:hypothetical protein